MKFICPRGLKILIPALVFFLFSANCVYAIHFIPNQGQWEPNIIARANLPGGWLWLDDKGLTYLLYDAGNVNEQHHSRKPAEPVNAQVFKVYFKDAQLKQSPVLQKFTSEYYNFFVGNDKSKWKSRIYGCRKIYLSNIYPGIDFTIYADGDMLKYDFIVKPGGDPAKINIAYEGQQQLLLTQAGDLIVKAQHFSFTEKAPVAYQHRNKKVKCNFLKEGSVINFTLGNYNKNRDLVIDPQLIFSTFSGSRADNFGYTATYDAQGNAYSGGTVFAPGFPVTTGAFQLTFGGGVYVNGLQGNLPRDIGILKYTPDGSQLIYCTYLGGKHNEDPHSMVVNPQGELLVFGNSYSINFPVTNNAFDTSLNGGSDIIVSKFSPDGTQLLSSTFVGGTGNDALNGVLGTTQYKSELAYNYGDTYRGEIISDSAGSVYIATVTSSADFPVKNGYQDTFGGGLQDACILKMNPDLSQMVWSTYLGGVNDDAAYSIYRAKNGLIYTCGGTRSPDFLKAAKQGVYNQPFSALSDGFVAALSSDGANLLYSTYLGTTQHDQCFFVQLDKDENVFVTGQTRDGTNFPKTQGLYVNDSSGQFIIKFGKQLDTILLSTTFGSGRNIPDISPSAFLVDECGQVYLSGWGGGENSDIGSSTFDLPITQDAFQDSTDGSDFYLAMFTHDLKQLVYASFFGGKLTEEHVDGGTSRFDKRGVVYQSVCACEHSDFPTTENAWSRINKGRRPNNNLVVGCNNAIFKIAFRSTPGFSYSLDTCSLIASFKKDSSATDIFEWSFGDGGTSKEAAPVHKYGKPGMYQVILYFDKGTSCQDSSVQMVDIASKRDKEIKIFNVITPNNDGLNEYFHIPEFDLACEDYEISIYNRWGQYMFHEKGRYLQWKGTTLNGKPAAEGTYFYIINAPSFGEFKGTITVIR